VKLLGDEVFNPLDKTHLAESVSDRLLGRPIVPLPPPKFKGAGIYAIYYGGGFPAYQLITRSLSAKNPIPIYVGKAVPAGSRKGGYSLTAYAGHALFNRLCDHVDSINAASNLDLADFSCRYLLVDDIWIPLGESLLIEIFKPVWNVCVDGFGHHDQGKSRRTQIKSRWDTLHPGRPWAEKVERPNPKTAEQIADLVVATLEGKIEAKVDEKTET